MARILIVKQLFKNKVLICILSVAIIDLVILCFLLTSRSFPRLAVWNIIESDKPESFYWRPSDKPGYFYFEPKSEALLVFCNDILDLAKDENDEFKRVVKIAKYTASLIGRNATYRLNWDSPTEMLKQIKTGKFAANCFLLSILYSTYLASIDIPARLWTLEGNDELGKISHTVNEVYVGSLKKWVLIDIMDEVYFTKDSLNLSLLELRQGLLNESAKGIQVNYFMDDERNFNQSEFLENYRQLVKCAFLRAGNDFVNRYDSKLRYGVLRVFQKHLDLLPSQWRRGISYLFGRKDFLVHYVDIFSKRLKAKIIAAKAAFYFFIISSGLTLLFGLGIILGKIWRKSPLTISLSKKQTRQR